MLSMCKSSVETLRPEMATLIETLKPLWWLTHHFGILPDWCVSLPRSRLSKILNWIGVAVTLSAIVMLGIFEMYQLHVRIRTMQNIHNIVDALLWSLAPVTVLTCILYILIRRRRLLRFFSAWNHLEQHSLIRQHWQQKTKRTLKLVRVATVVTSCFVIICNSFMIFGNPNLSYLPSHYAELNQLFTEPIVYFVEFMALFYVFCTGFVCSVIPTVVYYQAALVVRAVNSATRQLFDSLERRRNVRNVKGPTVELQFVDLWSIYEQIGQLVTEINDVIGFFVIEMDSYVFVGICLLTDTIFSNIKVVSNSELIFWISALLFNSYVLLDMTYFAAQLHISSRQLVNNTSLWLSDKVTLLTKQELDYARLFLNRIDSRTLQARPCDLYTVDYSLLLQILSVVVTYTIILVQFK